MRRTIFNQHKIKRKWGRRVEKIGSFWSYFFSDSDYKRYKRDYSRRRLMKNPHILRKTKVDWGFRVKVSIICISVIVTMALGFYHPFFYINDIQIEGIQRIDENELRDTVLGIISYNKLFVFPQKSFFLANVDDIRNIILNRYPIKSVIVRKTFPDNLSIIIEEKISTIIYDSGNAYSYLDLNGKLVETILQVSESEWIEITETTTSTNEVGEIMIEEKIVERIHKPDIGTVVRELGDYPIIFDNRGIEEEINKEILDPSTVAWIIKWFNYLTKSTDIPIKYFVLEDELGNVSINTAEGWIIKSRLKRDVEEQFEELQLVVKEKINRPYIQYIDLRYKGRVYWQ